MIFVLFKLKMQNFAIKKVNELGLNHFSAFDIEKILGSFVENGLNVPSSLLEYLLKLLKNLKISSAEIVGIVYLLNEVKGTDEHFSALENLLEKSMHLISNTEKIHIFTSFIVTHKENDRILSLFAKEFDQGDLNEQITTVFPAFVKRNNLFLPYTQGLLHTLHSQIQGKVLKTQDLLITIYTLSFLKYQNENF